MDTTQTLLLRAVRDGRDTEAWRSFYRIYATMVGQFARRLGLSAADAEDVTQEVFLVAHKALRDGLYDPAKGRFRAWLYGVARRQSLAKLRERHRRTRLQLASDDSNVDLLAQLEDPGSEERAESVWQEEWRYALLEEALRHVQPQTGDKAFRAFVRHGIERHPVDQVAAELGIAPSSVYVYKRRVLTAVRQWVERLEQYEREPPGD